AMGFENALAVAVSKRSGWTTTVAGHWDAIAPRVLDLVTLHLADAVPDKAGHELTELDRAVPELPDVQRSEALRILRRKRAKRGKEKVAEAALLRLEGSLRHVPAAALGREITLAALIARAKRQAAPSPEEGA